jgi:hypothetical protein
LGSIFGFREGYGWDVKRWLKRIGYCVFALLLFLALSITVEHVRGCWMLHHRLNQLKAQDFMNGRPLRYRLSPADDFILYSVGEDGNDDGGDRALRKANGKYTRIWDGKDAVWPIRATSEEAARALSSP